MTEPKVGMKFGNYKQSLKNLGKSYEQNGNQFFDKNGKVVATANSAINNQFLIFGVKDNTTNLTYSGMNHVGTPTDAHNFTQIQGEKMVASDLNGNNKIDENELFEIKTDIDGSKYYIDANGKHISL